MKKIYLDYNATTPVAPSVLELMTPFFAQHHGNPSSAHTHGRACAEVIDDSRGKLSTVIDCNADEIIFTGGGTEANNLALKGVFLKSPPSVTGHLIISAIEHPAITAPAKYLESLGVDLTVVDCDKNGVVQPESVAAAIRSDTALVSIMHSNNEIGTIQPIGEIARICRAKNILVHTDASQSVGKVPVNVDSLGVDMLTIAGHKFYGPKGVGALYLRSGVVLQQLLHGAGHERGMRAGTENTPGVVGLAAAARLAAQAVDESHARLSEMRNQLENALRANVEDLVIHGEDAERLPNTSSVSFPGVTGIEILNRCPEISASTGSACHSHGGVSSTLEAMNLPHDVQCGTIRLSLGWQTTQEEIERVSSLLVDAWEQLHQPTG